MTGWLLIYSDGTVGPTCRAEDRWTAERILGPVAGQFVVSSLSWSVARMATGRAVSFQGRQSVTQADTREGRPRLHQRHVDARESKRRWKERLMADPVRWGEYLERKRERYRRLSVTAPDVA